MSCSKVEAYVKPSQASVDAVNAYLKSHGITATTLSPAGDWLGFSVPVSKANEMFDADFSVFNHTATGSQTIRTLSYSIPTSLKQHLDFVHPTTKWVLFCAYMCSYLLTRCVKLCLWKFRKPTFALKSSKSYPQRHCHWHGQRP